MANTGQLKTRYQTHRYRPRPGLRVVSERHSGALSAAVGVFVGCGSRHESAALHGATHLAEHLFFKGTSKHTAEEISNLVERHGGDINAFTDRECTTFHAWIPVEQLEPALELLLEMLYDSLFDEKEFVRERDVVLQELRSYSDNPDEEFQDGVLEIPMVGHPLGRRIAGFEKGVARFKRDEIVNYVREQFLRSEIVLSIVSPLSDEKVRALVGRVLRKAEQWRWGHLLGHRGVKLRSTKPHIPAKIDRRSKLQRFDGDQVQFSFMFPAVSIRDKREPEWSALVNLLGGGSSSRLFREVREKRGLAYSTHAQLYGFTDVGLMGGYLATDPKHWIEAVRVVGETCRNFAANISHEDVDFVKSMMEGAVYMGYDSLNNRMESLGRQELLLGKPCSLSQAVREVRAITRPALQRLARQLMATPSFFALGPVSQRELPKVIRAWKGES